MKQRICATFTCVGIFARLLLAVAVAAPLITSAAPWNLDLTFGADGHIVSVFPGYSDMRAGAMVRQADDKVIVGGRCLNETSTPGYGQCFVRYNSNGTVDASYGVNGVSFVVNGGDLVAGMMGLLPNGKLLVARYSNVVRLNSDGTLDTSFGTNGTISFDLSGNDSTGASSVTPLANGEFLVAAHCTPSDKRFCSGRFDTNGSLVATHAIPSATAYTTGLISERPPFAYLQTDGKIVVVGTCWNQNIVRACSSRLHTSGSAADTTYGSFGVKYVALSSGANFYVTSYALQNADKLLIGGFCVGTGNNYDSCVARLLSNGQTDSAFATSGVLTVAMSPTSDDRLSNILVGNDQSLMLVSGCDGAVISPPSGVCARLLNADGGAFSAALGPSSEYGLSRGGSAAMMTGGKIVSSQECWIGSTPRFCLVRLKGGPYDATTCTLNADLDNQVAGNDGILAIRHLLGFTGDALTDGTLGQAPGRTAQQIEEHLAQLKTDGKLDVDGDGEANAMTDGLLILRAMLGLSGDALIAGARNAAHPNVRDAKQILTWIESTHGVACLP